MLVFK